MSIHHATPGEVIDISPLGSAVATSKTVTIVKTASLEVIRLVLPEGKIIPEHKVPREMTVQCLEGEVDFTTAGQTQRLTAGKLLCLSGNQLHAVHAVTDASMLVTILLS